MGENTQSAREYFWNLSLDILCIVDFNNRFQDVSPAFERILGYSRNEVLGRLFTDFLHPDDLAATLSEVSLHSTGHVARCFENRYRCKDGSYRWLSWNSVPVPEESLIYAIARDVTEHKKSDEALKISESNFRQLWETMTRGVVYQDSSGKIISMNPAADEILGKPPEEFVGSSSVGQEQYTVREDGSPFPGLEHPAMISLRTGRDVQHVVMGVYNPREKAYRWINVSAVPLFKPGESKPYQVYTIFDDITQRKKAEEALKESKAKLEAVFESMTDAVFISDIDGNFIDFNEAFATYHRFKNKEECYKKLAEYPNYIDVYFADGTLAPLDMWAVPRALRGEKVSNSEYILRRKDTGETWWGSYSFGPIRDKDGRIVGSIVVGRDITESKKAQEALRQTRDYLTNLLDYANAPIIVWDPSFRITQFNHAFERLTGRTAGEVIGSSLDILFPKDVREHSMEHIRRAAAGERMEVEEIPIQHKSGSVRTVLWNSATLYDRDNKTPTATIAQGQDITERKKAEEALRQYTRDLESANKELESFSYTVSHDLRAPLRSLDGFSLAILEDYEDKLDTQGQEYLQKIRSSSQLMAKLIDDILTLSRVSRAPLNLEVVNLSDLAEKVVSELKRTDPERKVEFKIEPWVEAYGDKNLLKLVMDNLLGNAYKFTGKCPNPVIEFGMKPGNVKTYFIKDNGAGFDMEYAEHLFKPFQRLHSVEDFPGTGIGLASVLRIIQRHGGRIWAEGEVGKGAAFYFTLNEERSLQ